MTIRRFLAAVLVAAVAVTSFALSADRVEWGNGPAQFLMTKEEAAQWKAITTDEAADRFVALFWARRDPTPDTPRNEFREEFEIRVKQADANFAAWKTKGSMTDRGKMLILFGQPKKMERSGGAPINTTEGGTITMPSRAPGDDAAMSTWIYDEEPSKRNFNVPRASIRFTDAMGRGDYKIERGAIDLTAAQQRAIERSITRPNLTDVPTLQKAQQPAPAAAAPPAAPVAQTELTTEALKSAVADFKKSGKSEKQIFVSTGEFVTSEGQTFAPVLVYIPQSLGVAAGAEPTFFGVVEDASGKGVVAFEQPVKVTATKNDLFVDKSLTLPAGKHRGYFGLAENGKVIAIASADMELAGTLDNTATAASGLILSNNVYPLTEAQKPTDPFAFGGLKVVPKADKTFRNSDELWYFVELRNPGLPEAAPAAEGAAAAEPMPKIQVKMDVEGTDAAGTKIKRSAPPMEVDAIPLRGVPNHYGLGSSIPLTSFKPGTYDFKIKVIDTVKKTSYTLSDKFRVVE